MTVNQWIKRIGIKRLSAGVIVAGFLVLQGQACSSGFTSTMIAGNGKFSSTSGTGGTELKINCKAPGMRGVSKSGVRRLNKNELVHTAQRMIPDYGFNIMLAMDSFSDVQDMNDVNAFSQVYSLEQMENYAKAVDATAQIAISDPYRLGGDCLTKDNPPSTCFDDIIKNKTPQIWRRPLTPEDTNFLKTNLAGLSKKDWIYKFVTIVLKSPDALFHIESGVSEEASRVRLSDYEVANRISYALTGYQPDDTLLQAAANGELETLDQVEAQARRIMKSDGAKSNLQTFYSEWLQYNRFVSPPFEISSLASGLNFGQNDLRKEMNSYLDDVFFKNPGTFYDLMNRTTVFPNTDQLAGAYGTSGADGNGTTPFDSPDHPGLLTRVAMLSEAGAYTSPIKRGVFIKRRILCDVMPTPDFSIVAARLDELGNMSGMDHANFELTNAKTTGPQCISCHSTINPMGFALEAFDIYGKVRDHEAYVDWTNIYSSPQVQYYRAQYHGADHKLPYPVGNVVIAPGQSITVNTPKDLTDAIGKSERAMACMSTFVLRHNERRVENSGDTCAINDAAAALKAGAPVSDVFVKLVATEDIFWRAK